MNILVLSPYVPYPPAFGGAVRIYHLVRQLARRHRVTVLCYRERQGGGDPAGMEAFCRRVVCVPRHVKHKRLRQALSLAGGVSFQTRSHTSRAMQAAITRVAAEDDIDLVLAEFSQMGGFAFPAEAALVVDEHNVEYELLERMAGESGAPLRRCFNRIELARFRREELAFLRRADRVLTTSERDAQTLRRALPGLEAAVVGNGVDCDYFRPPAQARRRPQRAVFVGAAHYFPNEDGIRYFLERVAPAVRRRRPDFELYVVGGRPSPALLARAGPGTTITGFVEDVRPYMWNAALFVVPLRMGGGTRFKVVEALAAGVPVVSTRLGAEGIPVENGRELLLADEPAEFAEAVLRVLERPEEARAMAGRGLAFVRERFDWDVIGRRLEAALPPPRRTKT